MKPFDRRAFIAPHRISSFRLPLEADANEVTMKAKAIFLGVLVAAAAFAAQDTVQFKRNYVVGDQDRYRMKMVGDSQFGSFEISMLMSQTVKLLHDNGDADVETSMTEFKIMAMGQEMSPPGMPPTTQRITPSGEVKGGAPSGANPMALMRFAMVPVGTPMKVGETVPVNHNDEKAGEKIVGSYKVESVTEGIAKVVTNLEVTMAEAGEEPMKMSFTTLVEVKTSKMNQVSGSIKNLPAGGLPVDEMKFSLERIR
jgi:hypothetical protein